jgi:hypothetical protein
MKLQKHYLEVSNSFRNEVRAFLRFTAERKNYELFQMSQKKRLEILRCVVLLKVFSKKRSFSVQKTRPPLPSKSKSARHALRCKAVGLLFVMILLSVGNHFESKSARYALLCKAEQVAGCYNSAKLKLKHFRSDQRGSQKISR